MKKLTATAAALAAAFISFSASAQPHSSKENVSVASAADNTIGLPGVWGSTSTLRLEASHAVKAPRGKARAGKHVKRKGHHQAKLGAGKRTKVVLNARRGSANPGVDMMQTASVGGNAATTKAQYSTIVSRYAAAYNVPAALAHAVIKVESNYRANARGGAGEIGLMQIKPATARMMGYSGGANGLFNPETNIKYGMKYLAKAHSLGGGSTCGTILKYNAGHGAKRMNPVSAAYCSKVKQQLAMN